MRLVKKKQIFCNSRDRTTGTQGNFSVRFDKISEPGEYKHKIYLQQFVIRKDFYTVQRGVNSTFAYGNSIAPFSPKTIPPGAYTVDTFVSLLNNILGPDAAVAYNASTGKLEFGQLSQPHRFDFDFLHNGYDPGTAELFGFDALAAPATWVLNMATGLSPPTQIDLAISETIDVCTSVGGDRFETDDRGQFGNSRVMASASLAQVQFMGDLVYTDTTGANGVFITSDLDNLDVFDIQLRDDHRRPILPNKDWPFIVAVEFWWDSESEQLKISRQISSQFDTTIKFLQIISIALDKDETLPPPPDEVALMAIDIPGMVPFGYRLPDDLFAGKRARFNTLI